jgi:murein L,D-transpeptidase YafK
MLRLVVIAAFLLPGVVNAETEDLLPRYLIQVPASVVTILVAEAETSTLHRYGHGEGGIDGHDTRYMSVGQNGVGKAKAWDRRTPLGVYFVTDKLDTSGMHERYGPAAFPLDYPNVWDRNNERTGDGIWIHGVTSSSERRPPRDTDGCIALPNDELLRLESLLRPTVTPVIIAREIEWISRAEIGAIRSQLNAALEAWADSYRSGDLHQYLSLYAEDFEFLDMDRSEWAAYRLQAIALRPVDDYRISNVLLLSDPEESGLYLSRFVQTITHDAKSIVTTKRLYWKRSSDGALKIVAEDNG